MLHLLWKELKEERGKLIISHFFISHEETSQHFLRTGGTPLKKHNGAATLTTNWMGHHSHMYTWYTS